MSKWKCEICGNEFENFHAQGFDNKIYCPLCYFKKENQELKKQLENMADSYCNASKLKHERASKIVKMNNQQKEFIKWLEDYLNLFDEKDIYEEGSYDTIEEVLQKYKSIIGVSE